MSESTLIVNIVIDNKIENVTYTSTTTAEDVCILLCKQLGITPVARHLFALRDSKLNFLMSASLFNKKHTCFDLRIRYKVANIGKLKDIDQKAYDYYFHQARTDVLENKIPDLVYEKYKNELLGLGVTDMYRVMLEKDIPRESVENDYKKYIPKAALKRHPLFIKKPIHDSLGKLKKSGHNSFNYVKMEYLKQLEMLAPEYLAEEFKAISDFEGSSCIAYVKVSPYHNKDPGIRICKESNRENWQQLCTIDELCYISVREDGTVEISRKNGIPFYLKFPSLSAMYSFVSLLDGYYRLMCKWIFNICKDVLTPSLQRLYSMRCHGPVGGEFSYAKLEEKRGNRPGCFILRESELKYNIFYIDVCMKETLKPKTFKLELLSGTEFIFNNDLTRYKNINQLIATYNDPNGEIFLQECLPPSEYDTSPLLLCQSNFVTGDSLADSSSIHGITSTAPVCISSKNIQVYKGRKCLKWNKVRNKVKQKDEIVKQNKYEKTKFPDESLADAKKFCRNPNSDVGGPWCFVEVEDSDLVEAEYCDIPFCDDEDCTFFSKNYTTYSHYLDFNHTLTNLTFGLKLWDSDSYYSASARLVLSTTSLPFTAKQIEDAGIGIEIFLSNENSALTFGNKDKPEYEPSVGLIKSTEFTFFSLSWARGFITLNKEGEPKPIFLAEYKTKKNLLGFLRDKFNFYSTQSTNVLWSFPFCDDEGDCDVHTTTSSVFNQFWMLRETGVGHDLQFFVRAFHSAYILLVTSPAIDFPCIEIMLDRFDNVSRIQSIEYPGAPKTILKEISLSSFLNYWKWSELSVSLFADNLQVYVTKDVGTHVILEIKHNLIRKLRWFSPSSENSIAHWTFYCKPPQFANSPEAWPPECSLNKNEPEYKGTQWVTHTGLPCIPWSSVKLLPDDAKSLFSEGNDLKSINYCRDPKQELKGTFCYAITQRPEVKIKQKYCHIRPCKSSECRMAGTGNDYIGKLNTTRSNRTCKNWVQHIVGNNISLVLLNETLYADMSAQNAENYCRNPTRNIAGSWCYTTDSGIQDVCNVRDCNKPEECTVLIRGNGEGQKKESSSGTTVTYRSMWRLTKGKKVEVAMKVIKHESQDKYLRNFMELAGNWSCLQSTAIIKLYGITLVNPVSMVMEYVRLGPLDQFLKENKSILKTVDLVEATSTLASALWHLEENGIVHGNIRCKKILVCSHQENEFKVKLADPGIHTTYASKEVHWIPVECYSNLDFAKKSTAADVWAFATTAWEIFRFGEAIPQIDHIDAMRLYAGGKRLPQPEKCPADVYQLMKECWEADPHRRKQPQALMRDINQILYQVYNSRRVHSYAQVNFSRSRMTNASSNSSISSNITASTAVVGDPPDELISICDISQSDCDLSDMSNFSKSANSMEQNWLLNSLDMGNNEDGLSYNTSNVFSAFNFSMTTSVTSLDSISSMQSIFELDADCNVILQGRIGQGFYGDVYKGTLEYFGDKDGEARKVAVKKLKTSAASTCIQDFEREISIMKTLKHPNIVEILGVLQDPEVSLVMEFVQYGSLQSYLKIHHETLSIKQLVKYASDIAQGMDYLGTKHIVHRDLAARNILVVDDTHVKISDFGLAQVMGTNEYYILKTNRELPIKWYAPESLRDGKFSSASDVWSYGVTLCEMFSHGEEPKLPEMVTGKLEGQEQQILLNAIETGARFPCPPICPQSIYVRLIYPCWKANPHERPKFFDLCKETETLLQEY